MCVWHVFYSMWVIVSLQNFWICPPVFETLCNALQYFEFCLLRSSLFFFFFKFWWCPLHFRILLSALDLCSIFYNFPYAPRFYTRCFSFFFFCVFLSSTCLSLSLSVYLLSLAFLLFVCVISFLSVSVSSFCLCSFFLFLSPSSMDSSSSSFVLCASFYLSSVQLLLHLLSFCPMVVSI